MAIIKTMQVGKSMNMDKKLKKAMNVGKARMSKQFSKQCSSGKPSRTVGKASNIGIDKHTGLASVVGRCMKLPAGRKPSQALRVKMVHVPMKDSTGD